MATTTTRKAPAKKKATKKHTKPRNVRTSSIGIRRVIENRTKDDRIELISTCIDIAVDSLQVAKAVGKRNYGPAKKNIQRMKKNVASIRL